MRRLSRLALFLALTLLAGINVSPACGSTLRAAQVSLLTPESGCGLLFQDRRQFYVLAPGHLVEESGGLVTLRGPQDLQCEAEPKANLPMDVALLRVLKCTDAAEELGELQLTPLDARMTGRAATLWYCDPSGTVSAAQVYIESVSPLLQRMRLAMLGGIPFHKGLSGAIISLDGNAIGMLLSADEGAGLAVGLADVVVRLQTSLARRQVRPRKDTSISSSFYLGLPSIHGDRIDGARSYAAAHGIRLRTASARVFGAGFTFGILPLKGLRVYGSFKEQFTKLSIEEVSLDGEVFSQSTNWAGIALGIGFDVMVATGLGRTWSLLGSLESEVPGFGADVRNSLGNLLWSESGYLSPWPGSTWKLGIGSTARSGRGLTFEVRYGRRELGLERIDLRGFELCLGFLR